MRASDQRSRVPIFGMMLAVVVTTTGLLAGCGGAHGADDTVAAAEIVAGYDCLAPNLDTWVLPPEQTNTPDPEHPDAPDAGRVPSGFTPTAAVRCDLMATVDDAEGQWRGVTAVTLTGDLTPLVAALAEPDDAQFFGPCTADMEIVPPLWLVDATGRAINAHYPLTGCGKTKPGVRDALAALTVQDSTTLKQTLVEPRAALDSGCAVGWTIPIEGLVEGVVEVSPGTGSLSTDVPSAVPGTPTGAPVPTDFDAMRWCRYAADAAPVGAQESDGAALPGAITLHTGRFVAGGLLDASAARLVAGAAAAEPVPHSCDASATAFVALWPTRDGQDLGMAYTAELDGCELLYRDGSGTRPLPADVRELLLAQTAH